MTKDKFRKKLEKAAILSGQMIDKNLPDALYDEIKDEDDGDILLALKDIAYSSERINLNSIMKNLVRHKAERIERESKAFKEQEKREIEKFIRSQSMPKEVAEFLARLKRV